MRNTRIVMRGLFAVGIVAFVCAYGLTAERSTDKNREGAAPQKQTTPRTGTAQPGTSQPGTAPSATTPSRPTVSTSMPEAGQAMMLHRSSKLMGKQAKDSAGEDLGSIHDLVLTQDHQQVSYVALSSGGVMGIGSQLHAIPWQAVQVDQKGNITIAIRKDQLKDAPGFSSDQWPSQADTRLLGAGTMREGQISRPSTDAGISGRSTTAPADRSVAGSSRPGQTADSNSIYGRSGTARSDRSATDRDISTPSSTQRPGSIYGTAPRGRADIENRSVQMRRVSHLTGMSVENPQNEDIGNIEDFVIDVSEGQVVYSIVSFGGFWGIGEKYAAVPLAAIQWQPRNNVAVVNADRKTLESIAFNPSEFPDLSDRQYAQRIFQAFNVEPYWMALGYVPPEDQQAASDKAWGSESQFAKTFDAGQVKTIKGTVESVGTFQPEGAAPGVAGGLRLRVKTGDGNLVTVYAGPDWYARQQNFFVNPGDQITITGAESKIGWRSVVVASEIKTDDKTLQLRDPSGKPLWRGQAGAMSTRPGQMGTQPGQLGTQPGPRRGTDTGTMSQRPQNQTQRDKPPQP